MSDLQRNDSHDLIIRDNGLKKKHLAIVINEKITQMKQLDITLERMKTVDFKKIELQKEILAKEIEERKKELKRLDSVDAEIIK